jgi:hypothetical protein
VCGEEEKERNRCTCALASPGQARHGVTRWGEWQSAKIQSNSLHTHTTFFGNLFLLCVRYIFNMEIESVMGRLNPRQFFSINMYDRHTNNNSFYNPTNTSRFLPSSTVLPSLLHPNRRHALATGWASLSSCRPQWFCTGREQIKFLWNILCDYSIALSSSWSMTCLPLHQACVNYRHLQHAIPQTEHRLLNTTVINE